MANIKNQPIPGFYATSMGNTRGSPTRASSTSRWPASSPYSFDKEYPAEHIWKSFTTFIRAVMPVAEKNNVRIGLHPDDPPVVAARWRGAHLYATMTPTNGLFKSPTATTSAHASASVPGAKAARAWAATRSKPRCAFGAKKKIFKIHFRNVSSPLPKFRETFVDNGYMDMYKVMKALRKVNFDGIIIPDHVPGGGMYPQANYAYTLGYMKALRDRVNAEG